VAPEVSQYLAAYAPIVRLDIHQLLQVQIAQCANLISTRWQEAYAQTALLAILQRSVAPTVLLAKPVDTR
jgi:hypothetical protein